MDKERHKMKPLSKQQAARYQLIKKLAAKVQNERATNVRRRIEELKNAN